MNRTALMKPPPHLDVQEQVEAIRFGLWWKMMQYGQGHVAHRVLTGGYLVNQFLAELPCPLGGLAGSDFDQWLKVKHPFVMALIACGPILVQEGVTAQYHARIQSTISRLNGLGFVQTGHPGSNPNVPPAPGGATEGKGEQCEGAPSQVAEGPSLPTSSPAETTGIPLTGTSNSESTPLTTTGRPEGSEQGNSGSDKPQSSARQKKLRGTGWPKRPNPYTKPKRGKG